ncbi:relaxase/mobilization nuclease domain-containing protein [Planctomicrobium sp. SH668]|uniref:relaxase/mobilization nuclease domain-containing protein n=1 Tax=Planctomicrobium sp. SH668 TaxID=3448126 RepID=UPI003F5B35D3
MFVEITRGRSFKGLAQYCLHDVDRKGDSRVAFIETQNLGTDDPQLAWRIMSARHYLQDELKEKAGIGRGGTKDGKPVGHVVISWKKEEAEAEQLNHQGMLHAAHGALQAIGASDRQALIIGHTDTPHPHCHIIVNLIGDDGRLKKNWKEREKLSKFALQREREIHGEALVQQREKNWRDREAGEKPVPVKKQPRNLYELEKVAKHCPDTQKFARDHKKQLADLAQSKESQTDRHKRHQERLRQCHAERKRRIIHQADQQTRQSQCDIRKTYQQPWKELLNKQEAARLAFQQNEQTLKGSLANAMQLIDWKQVLRRKREPDQLRLVDAFQLLTNESVRKEKLRKQQQVEQEKLRARQRKEEQAKAQSLQQERAVKLREERKSYLLKAEAMKQRQRKSQERLKEQQQVLTKRRNDVIKSHQNRERQRKLDWARKMLLREEEEQQQANDNRAKSPQKPPAPQKPKVIATEQHPQREPEAVKQPVQEKAKQEPVASHDQKPTRIRRERKERQPRQPREPRRPREIEQSAPPQEQQIPRTNPADLLPQNEKTADAAKQIDDFRERMMKELNERFEQDHDRDHDRR